MDVYKQHIELIGRKAVDKITGFGVVIDSISFDLYGCVQALVKPSIDKEGLIPRSYWVDVSRLKVNMNTRVD